MSAKEKEKTTRTHFNAQLTMAVISGQTEEEEEKEVVVVVNIIIIV